MSASIIGGGSLTFALDANQMNLAQLALDSAASAAAYGGLENVLGSTTVNPTSGDYNIYNQPFKTGVASLPTGGQAVVVSGTTAGTITGLATATDEVLVGNQANDTINAAGGSGTIVAGNGANIIHLNGADASTQPGGSQQIFTGTGSDTISMFGGQVTVQAETGGSVTVKVLGGNDTISFGSGGDTAVVSGTATITSGAAGTVFTAGTTTTTTASVIAGSGNSTLIGGKGNDTFAGGSGSTSMTGGTKATLFIGGTGSDTMTASTVAGSSAVFDFNSVLGGGSHTITNFVASDTINLIGYAGQTPVEQVVGGNTIITLGDNTTITLTGYTGALTGLHTS